MKSNHKFIFSFKILLFLLCVFSFSANAQSWSQITKAVASDASTAANFGCYVDTEGDYSVVRAAGAIYIFNRDAVTGVWSQKQKIEVEGSGAVGISGDYIAVVGNGALYVFKKNTATKQWAQQQKIAKPSDGPAFTGAVGISGNYIVAGATGESEDVSGSAPLENAGAAYIYQQTSGVWAEQQKIVASTREAGTYFGSSVAISGNYIVVGASGATFYQFGSYGSQTASSKNGSACVYKRNPDIDIWSSSGCIYKNSTSYIYYNVGSVDIQGDYIVVGAYYINYETYYPGGSYTRSGYDVSVFMRNSAEAWPLKQTFTGEFGDSNNAYLTLDQVSICGDYVFFDYYGKGSYLNKKDSSGKWVQVQALDYGSSVNVSGEDIIIGKSGGSSNTIVGSTSAGGTTTEPGAVYYYKMDPYAKLLATSTDIGAGAGSKASVDLIYNTPFTVSSNQSWLSVTPSGISPVTISDTISLAFTASSSNNTGAPRSAKVTVVATGVANQYIIVTQKVGTTVSWDNPADIAYGTALSGAQLNATANIPGTFTYTPAMGTILNVGNNQALKVVFTPTDAANYETVTKTVYLNVTKPIPDVSWETPADITYGTPLGAMQLNAKSTIQGTFVYTPPSGTVLGMGDGQTLKVVFTATDLSNYSSVTKTVQINVKKGIPQITWGNPADIVYGTALSSVQLNATAAISGKFTYNPALGTVLGLGTQTLQVTFTPDDQTRYDVTTKTVQILVTKAQAQITWANPADIVYGTALSTVQLNALASVAGTFVYTPKLGTVMSAGNGQQLKVDFSPNDAVNYGVATKTVLINVKKDVPVITWSNPADIVYGTALSAQQLNATANVSGTFVYTPASGTILSIGTGQQLKVVFTPKDVANYEVVTKNVVINVSKSAPEVTWANPADIGYGTVLSSTQLNAKSNIPGTFVYTPPIGTLLEVADAQLLKAVFTPLDMTNYASVTKTVQINVKKGTPQITWQNPANMIYGTALSSVQLNATANISGKFVYTPALGSILALGTQTIQVLFTPDDLNHYEPTTKTVQVVVGKAQPILSWDTPADITYGTALSSSQLCAKADVAGSFSYSPGIGAILNAGDSQSLRVDFVPTNTNYGAVYKIVQLNVKRAIPTVLWNTPSDVASGTALGASQLNATANVTGSFTYTPALGTILGYGNAQVLKVVFTPKDVANYESVTKTVLINVVQEYLSVDKLFVSIGSTEGSKASDDISSNVSWTASSDQSWLTISPSSSDAGNKTLVFTAAQNFQSVRVAQVTIKSNSKIIADKVITVSQAAITTSVEPELEKNISVYPNPVTDKFCVVGFNGAAILTLYDMSGRILFSEEIMENEFIPMKSINPGVYIVKVNILNKVLEKKLVKR